MLAKIKQLTAVVCVLLVMSSCTTRLVQIGGNVGALTHDEQAIIALDLFEAVQNALDRSIVITMRPKTHGETVFATALRQSGFAVQLVDSNPEVKLDFYYFITLREYAGVVSLKKKRVVRRYAEENNTLVALGTSVAWVAIPHDTDL